MTPLVSSRDIYAKAPLEPIFDDSLNDYFEPKILKKPDTAVHSSSPDMSKLHELFDRCKIDGLSKFGFDAFNPLSTNHSTPKPIISLESPGPNVRPDPAPAAQPASEPPIQSRVSKTDSNSCSRLVNTLINKVYEQSVFFAANNGAIQKAADQNQGLTWKQKIKIGAVKGAEAMLMTSGVLMGLGMGSMALGLLKPVENRVSPELPSVSETLGESLLSELLFRGAIQNCVAGAQKIATHITPKFLQNNRVFKWVTSPSARILGSSGIESAAYIFANTRKAALFFPVAGILYETTGSMLAPLAYNLSTSFATLSVLKLLKK